MLSMRRPVERKARKCPPRGMNVPSLPASASRPPKYPPTPPLPNIAIRINYYSAVRIGSSQIQTAAFQATISGRDEPCSTIHVWRNTRQQPRNNWRHPALGSPAPLAEYANPASPRIRPSDNNLILFMNFSFSKMTVDLRENLELTYD